MCIYVYMCICVYIYIYIYIYIILLEGTFRHPSVRRVATPLNTTQTTFEEQGV